MGSVSDVPFLNKNRTKSSSVAGNAVLRFPEEVVEGLENSSNVMREPWLGRVVKRLAEGPVERFEREKKASMGSKEPKKRVNLSATPPEAMMWSSCWRTAEARVCPAIEGIVPSVLGVLSSNCCFEARS